MVPRISGGPSSRRRHLLCFWGWCFWWWLLPHLRRPLPRCLSPVRVRGLASWESFLLPVRVRGPEFWVVSPGRVPGSPALPLAAVVPAFGVVFGHRPPFSFCLDVVRWPCNNRTAAAFDFQPPHSLMFNYLVFARRWRYCSVFAAANRRNLVVFSVVVFVGRADQLTAAI